MAIEYAMYFAIGFFSATLLAFAVGPAFWRRAVRLTRRRIEAATPVTLSEFRADKDKLRADFAIALRKREIRIDAMREQIAARAVALDAARTELGALKSERDEQFAAIEAYRLREEELQTRLRDLERDNAAMAARLRQADLDLSDVDPSIMPEKVEPIGADQLSGDYRADVEDLLTALSIERQRNTYLEDQARMLLARIEKKKKSGIKEEAIAMLRDTLAGPSDPDSQSRVELRKAEARISGAETRLNALLSDTGVSEPVAQQSSSVRLLAEDLSADEHEQRVREQVEGFEEAVMADWKTERFDAEAMRARLKAIAADVARLVYAEDAEDPMPNGESLFDRVRKFAADGLDESELAAPSGAEVAGPLSNRMDALRGKLAPQG